MAYTKKSGNKLEDLKSKWNHQEEKKAALVKRHQDKLDKVMNAINIMCDEQLEKTMENVVLYSGINISEAQRLFKELHGCTLKQYYKYMNSKKNPFEQ